MIEAIVWIIVAGVSVFLLYCVLGVVPLIIYLLKLPFRRTKKETTSSTEDETGEKTGEEKEAETNPSADNEHSEEHGAESSAVIDEEDN